MWYRTGDCNVVVDGYTTIIKSSSQQWLKLAVMTYLLPHFSSLFPIYVFLSFLIHHSQRSNTSLHKYVLLSMTLGCLLLYLFFFIYEKFENTFFPHCDIAIFLPWSLCCFQIRQIYQWLWASCRWCNRKPIGLRQDADPPHCHINELSYSICLWCSTLSLAGSPLPFAGWESVCGSMVSGV